jgi:hypothetical protein
LDAASQSLLSARSPGGASDYLNSMNSMLTGSKQTLVADMKKQIKKEQAYDLRNKRHSKVDHTWK